VIDHCDFIGNTNYNRGAGIYCHNSAAEITWCRFFEGDANYGGGGIQIYAGSPQISNCLFVDNEASINGGGINIEAPASPAINSCTFYGNSAQTGGGISGSGTAVLNNCILWNNTSSQASGVTVNYSCVQGGYAGTGNISQYPYFIFPVWDEYNLQWGSPCIDSGDPNPIYNDPDGTRADMGAYYYDQSMPQRMLLTPHETLIEIPGSGGNFDFTVYLTNIDPSSPQIQVLFDVTMPDGSIYGPIIGPVSVVLDSGQTVERDRIQSVPANAPMGTYSYNAYAVVGADTSRDSFPLVKLASDGGEALSDWSNYGESFDNVEKDFTSTLPGESSLLDAYPNPFNPSTVISYQLSVVSIVNLAVYDVSGRKVAELVDGWSNPGLHEIAFDGSGMASGVYVYRLQSGDFNAAGKMILME
jgi:hypothetical protein